MTPTRLVLALAAAPAPAVTVTETEEAPAKPAAKGDERPADEPAPAAAGKKIRVPNVVGKSHQLAQDTLQAAGLYSLLEEDATGQGRMLLMDRNWVVVKQDPKAGAKVAEDAPITLYSKKIGE